MPFGGERGLSYLRVHTCGHRSRSGRCYFPDEPSGANNRPGCPFHGNGNLENCKILVGSGSGKATVSGRE